ncbi:type I polyketide synthase [Nocardia suismassiliense]|uniref:type I polyketide synthase n=1 Tax=Nocardia suismassiliense TaxID=2077092 RepID=UPI00131EDDBA|nr:type I polyketide synthase [Nocardia suismassiliense]
MNRQSMDCDRIAVVGMSCRLPKAASPDAFWALLRDGASALDEAPKGRWTGTSTEPGVRRGGFLDEIGHFDAEFFGISPREAVSMDPQQRIVLELAWTALEDARIVADRLRAQATGVFVGSLRDDYAGLVNQHGAAAITEHTMTGVNRGVIANRVSYQLGLRGPSLTVDTGQSSSLVAVHLACESLRSGESTLAIAAGVNLNILAESALTEERFGGLSPDGECYTFDERANGFVRGEGAVVLVLKPLTAALADGDRIHGVLLGSAVNNDGATDGLTVPSAQAQELVVRTAHENAGIELDAVQYVELHGTGTPVGDPIEAAALGAALGTRRTTGTPLPVGSAKTNVGHLEGAAGIVGLLKVLLSMRHRRLPANRNFAAPNPRIPLAELNLAVQTELTPWPRPDRPLVAGVSSFGMGGTNCHLVVQDAPNATAPAAPIAVEEPAALPWILSGRSPAALRGQAQRLLTALEGADADPTRVSLSLIGDRAVFEHRAAVIGADRAELLSGLSALAGGDVVPGVVRSPSAGALARPRVVLLFPGQGHQWAGMALRLWASTPVFAESMTECARALGEFVDWELEEVLRATDGAAPLERVDVVQPVLFAVMVSLAKLWRSYGVVPDAVVGHSQGEIAAACVAGALSLRDAARVVALRAKLLTELAGQGGMASVWLRKDEVAERISPWAGRLSVAALNGPGSVVIAGEVAALEEFLAAATEDEVQTRRIAVDYASHSAQVEQIREELLAVLDGIEPQPTEIPFHSTVTGEVVAGTDLDAEYWYRNLRQTVHFEQIVDNLLSDERGAVFVEVSGHPMLAIGVAQTAEARGAEAVVVGSLRRGEDDPARFLSAVATAYVHGVAVDWTHAFPDTGVPHVDLPSYAFQRRRFWVGERTRAVTANGSDFAQRLAGADPAARRQALTELVRTHAAAVLEYPDTAQVADRKTFKDIGFDSRSSVELRNRLHDATGLRLPTSLLFDQPTPEALVRYLDAELVELPDIEQTPAPIAGTTDEPIAIVGMACRYPGGVESPADLWRLVAEGGDAISGFPVNRGWHDIHHPDPERPGKSYVSQGGFLHEADTFDAAFFGISPREALAMDPQQRLLLETAWQTLEGAGLDPETLRGSRTGVFIGAMASDYGPRMHDAPEHVEGHLLTGGTASVMSGRIAYQLGLLGPATTVDTACSSSVVALHLAIQSLRSGESTMAFAGGVTVMSTPGIFVEFSRQRGLATDGRCKPFAAAADGTSWAEGVGLLLVERLSDAQRNGHRILAVVRGSAVNSDGASNGLTAPNGPSQQRVIRAALADAGLTAADVDAVEAHGTGTTLGDPIEAEAIMATYGRAHTAERPLYLGSLKSNIGHAQAAAGVGGIIKMVEAIRHGVLPKTLHVDEPTPHVDWSTGAVELLTEARPWPATGAPARAAVSSFGISGTNAHVILERFDAEPAEAAAEPPSTSIPWSLSARDEDALHAQATRLRAFLADHPAAAPADVARTLHSRHAFERRAVITGRDNADLLAGLDALIHGAEAPNLVLGNARGVGSTAFLFAGQGAQHAGMGRELYAEFGAFADALDETCLELDRWLARPLREIIFADDGTEDAAPLHRTEYTQPALFAFEVALFRLLEQFGLTPDLLVGHSVGELTAGYVSGLFSLADAAKLIAARGRLMQAVRSGGAMIAVAAEELEMSRSLLGHELDIRIAAVNAPESVVISGDEGIAEFIAAGWAAQGRVTRRLRVSHAFHSPHMDEIVARFREVAEEVDFRTPALPIVSTLTGKLASVDELRSVDYWARQVSGTVRFLDAMRTLESQGVTHYLEVGPDATLAPMVRGGIESATAIIAPLRAGRAETESFLGGLATAYASGLPVDLAPVLPGAGQVELPTYAFHRERFWLAPRPKTDARGLGLAAAEHPLLATTVELAEAGGAVYTGRLSLEAMPWLADHAIDGNVLVPATAFLDLALSAGERVGAHRVDDLTLTAPLFLAGTDAVWIQVALTDVDAGGSRAFTVHSRLDEDEFGSWTRHATGVLTTQAEGTPAGLTDWPPAGAAAVDLDNAYARLAELGYEYGPAFQGLRAVWRQGADLFAEVRLPEEQHSDATRFGIHPALLDAVLHAHVLTAPAEPGHIRLPFGWAGAVAHAVGVTEVRARIAALGTDRIALTIADRTGAPVATIESLSLRGVTKEQLAETAQRSGQPLLAMHWPALAPPTAPSPPWTRVAGDDLATAAGAEYAVVDIPVGPHGIEAAHAATRHALGLARAWLADDRFADSRLVFVTSGAVAAGPGEDVPALSAAPIWGLIRSAQTEHPGRFVLVDLDDATADHALSSALASGEPQVAVRNGELRVPRATRVPEAELAAAPQLDPAGTVLIVGGTSGLGGLFARHLVGRHGVRRLLLCSRRGAQTPGVDDLVTELTGLGAEVTVAAVDVVHRAALAELLAGIPAEHPLTAVVHTAAVLADSTMSALTDDGIDTVFRPKVDAAWHLHELTKDSDLAAFILFSSVSGLVGMAGQANYAAANTYLDALAAHRVAAGLPATAQAWGLWDGTVGLGGTLRDGDLARWARFGVTPLTPDQGLALFDSALGSAVPLVVPAALNMAVLRDGEEPPVIFRDLVPKRRRRTAGSGAKTDDSTGTWLREIAELAEESRSAAISDLVCATVATALGYTDPKAIEPDRAFTELGVDSLAAVELRNQLGALTGLRLPSTVVLDYPSAQALTAFLSERVAAEQAPAADPILTGLDSVKAMIQAAGPDEQIVARLQELLELAGGGADRDAESHEDLASASDEELFAFIDDGRG